MQLAIKLLKKHIKSVRKKQAQLRTTLVSTTASLFRKKYNRRLLSDYRKKERELLRALYRLQHPA